jgi:hypothetical protein
MKVRSTLEARGLGAVSINVRITAVRKLAVEAADNGLLAPELANGITRVKGVASKGVRLGNWLTAKLAQALLNVPDAAPPRDSGTGRSWLCCSVAGYGVPKWLRSRSSTFSCGMVAGASWISSASTAGFALCRCRRGSRWR